MTLPPSRTAPLSGPLPAGATPAPGRPAAAQAVTGLAVYTAIKAGDPARSPAALNAAHPEINISRVRDSAGVVTARLLAEQDNPQAGIIRDPAAGSLSALKADGMPEPCAPQGLAALDPRLADGDRRPARIGPIRRRRSAGR